MFTIISIYRAKAGEEDAIIAMHENWDATHSSLYLSWMLFRNTDSPYDFIDITHFENEESAQAMKHYLDQDEWYPRLLSLLETAPVFTSCRYEWQAAQLQAHPAISFIPPLMPLCTQHSTQASMER
ncbi:hypothetical protein EPA93_47780 [Ktedonosporobacter rubrisoli]|uniref:ABM domain-containing protein n=1 Tax=Ktedonosporobacter rubrisoli TaxID=2509675 RepID=A0A4P6K5U8_KTERU|nr:hypothetical protein [Ktedonosporobacter rubrisoli]QBD83260.1 hypothetical protein EPA93_47780 [Ktedonosporobacter rubrisoli]